MRDQSCGQLTQCSHPHLPPSCTRRVYSTQATSLAHSLLFVSATPLFLAAGAWAIGRPTSATELGGTAVGLAGGIILATAAARSDAQVRPVQCWEAPLLRQPGRLPALIGRHSLPHLQATLAGDAAALVASLCFVGYLLIGRRLRAWMPAFVYAFG